MAGENLTRIETEERAALISTHTYEVELDLTTSPDTFRSVSTVTFSATTAGADTWIDLIAQSVQRIVLNGVELDPASYQDSRIPLPNLQEENTLTVDATCIYSHSGEGLHRATDPVDGEVYLYSQFEVPDARRMYAVFEQPDLKAEFSFSFIAPDYWNVFSVSPTPKPTPVREGVARWDFTPTERISSYLTCCIAGPYEGTTGSYTSVDGRNIPMGAYCRRSLLPYFDGDEVINITKQGMPFYETQYKQPYPFRKYDQIFVPEYNMGAMEHPGCVTILDDYVFRSKPTQALVERRAITILHELAHMWFGDLVTMKWWNDLWLNESFAEYMSHVATAETTRWTDAWVTFNSSEKLHAQRQDQLPSTHPIAAVINDLEDTMVNFDGITYGKGASVFQQLVAYVGWDAFITGVQKYLAKKAWSNATLDDLLVELSSSSGRDLEAWSKVWLEEAGINTFTPRFSLDSEGVITKFELIQSSDGRASLRPHRIGVGFYDLNDESLQRTEHIEIDAFDEVTSVPELVGLRRPAVILLNDGDLTYTKVRMDDDSLAFASEHINDFSDRLARTLVLDNAWDMCRDAEMPARDFVRLALHALRTEDHGTVLRYLLTQLLTATTLYSDLDSREDLESTVTTALFELSARTEPGSDRQLQITSAAISMARTQQQLATIASWLEDGGAHAPEGLAMDANMRWKVLNRLAEKNLIDEATIEEELHERDNTASGAANAARAKAGISTSSAKANAWADIIGGVVPNSVQRAGASGFGSGEPELLVPYVQAYFDEVENQWNNRTKEIASNMIEYAFPIELTGRTDLGVDLLDAGAQWLRSHTDSAPALVRLISEQLDAAQRAQRAQKCSASHARA